MQQRLVQRSALAIGVVACSVAAHGQQATADDILQPIDTITIIGRQSDVADVPGSAHVMDSEALAVFNDTDVLRVLRSVPGVYLQEEEGFGLRPNIGIRGSGLDRSARIALLEDGVLIAPAPYAAPSAYYFPTQRRMDSLEVLKGPASVVVGPRTTGGALNMISTPIPDDLGANVDLRVGEHNSYDVHANLGNRAQRVSWLLETVQGQSDGFMYVDSPLDGDTGFDIEDYVAKLQIDSAPESEVYQSLRVKLGYTDQTSEQTYLGLTDEDFAADPLMRYAATEGDVFVSEHEQYQVDYVIDPGNSWRASVTAYRNDFERNWYKLQSVNDAGLNSVLTDPDTYALELSWLKGATSPDDAITKRANNRAYYSQGVQAELQWDFGFGDTEVALNAGVRWHEDEEDRFQHQNSYRMEDGLLVMTTAGAGGSQTNRVSDAEAQAYFVNAEIRAGSWILTPGVRFEDVELRRFDYSTADPGRDQGPTRVRSNSVSTTIPGIGVLYRVNSDWRLLAGVHKGFNPPGPGSSADEESSLNIEVGTRYDSGGLRFEGIYFVNDYANLVGTVTDSTGGGGEIGDQYDGGEVKVAGLELSAGYEWAIGQLTVPINLEYTWTTQAEFRSAFDSNFDPWGDVQVGDELPYIPEHQLRAAAGIDAERWRVNVAANYLSQLRTKAGQGAFDPAESIDSRIVWDAMASWRFTEHVSAYLKVDNLFDETYIAARRPAGVRPGLPRTAYLGITYRL
ncbi:MAG: TonB-dependent receptor [Woeseiaceae bacterium]|nr:TonB-dependent receptor [Woeseiaceae bacterium]NIP19817.1 TonB-dependent receptor [Woeseiaceae bacterium]NIS89934.1 TonB-dependent receptor [Woeseiaceae bacterium]